MAGPGAVGQHFTPTDAAADKDCKSIRRCFLFGSGSEYQSEAEPGLPDPPVSMAEVRETAATIRAQLPGPTQEPVSLGDINEVSIRALFDDKGHLTGPDGRMAPIAR